MSQEQQPQQIKINDPIQGGEYANIAWINHNNEEFQLIFGNIAGNSGKVVSKIITTPGHLKRIIAALTENLKKYEEKFGTVKETAITNQEIGFQG